VVLGDEDAAADPEIAELAAVAFTTHGVDRHLEHVRDLLLGVAARQLGDLGYFVHCRLAPVVVADCAAVYGRAHASGKRRPDA
jgi:hypothetical protein